MARRRSGGPRLRPAHGPYRRASMAMLHRLASRSAQQQALRRQARRSNAPLQKIHCSISSSTAFGASVALPGDLSGSTPSCFSSENGAGPLTLRFEDPGGPLFRKQSRELLPGRRLTAFTIDPSADSVSRPPAESPATVSRLVPDFASHRAAARYKIHLSSWPNCRAGFGDA